MVAVCNPAHFALSGRISDEIADSAPVQVRLAALKREEDGLQRERETLEAAKLAHIKCGPALTAHFASCEYDQHTHALCRADEPSQCVFAVHFSTRCSAEHRPIGCTTCSCTP